MKKLFIFTLLSVALFARQYDTVVFDIEAKLFPKMMFLEKNIQKKIDSQISVVIIAEEIDFEKATEFKNKIEQKYPNGIKNKTINISIKPFHENIATNIDAIIVLSHEPEMIQTIASWANARKILSFSYDPADLNNGILASIYIGKSTKPYLNAEIIKEYDFIFDSYLLQLSKFRE